MIKKVHNKIYLISKSMGEKFGLDLPYFVKNGFWVLFRQGIASVGGLLLSVAFARLATQEVFGQYQFILSILSIASILSVPGLNTSIIQSVAKGCDGDYKKVVKTSFLWSLLGIPILLIVGGYYYIYQNHSLGIALMISSIFFPFFYAPNTWDSFLQGKSRFDISAKYSSIQSLINTVATIGIIFFYRNNLIAIVTAYLISFTFFNGYYYFKSLKYVKNEKSDKETIRYGWFLTRIGMLNLVSSNLDKIVVGIFLSQAQLAIYSVGILFSKQIQNVTKSALWIVAPKQIKQGCISKSNYLKIFFISSVIFIVFWFFSPLLITSLFSKRYEESILLTKISFLFYPVYAISMLYYNTFIFSKKEKNIKIESIATPLVRVALLFILLPFFGIGGLAFLFGFQCILSPTVLYVTERYYKHA